MIDIKTAREDIAKLHADATAHLEKYSTEAAPEADQKAQDERFAKMEQLTAKVAEAEKLAKYAYSKQPANGHVAIISDKSPDQVRIEVGNTVDTSREGYARAVSEWVRTGEVPEGYAAITTATGSGIMLPSIVASPLTPVKTNPFRRAYAMLGMTPESFGTTATVNVPVITSSSGGVITEGQSNTPSDGAPSVGNIALACQGYHSGTYWYSNMVIAAQTWDVTTSTLPALVGAEDYGWGVAIATAIIADATITQKVYTASDSDGGANIEDLDKLNQGFGLLYDSNKVIILGLDAYNSYEALRDTIGFPILQRNDVQNEHFLAYKGTPVIKSDGQGSRYCNQLEWIPFA